MELKYTLEGAENVKKAIKELLAKEKDVKAEVMNSALNIQKEAGKRLRDYEAIDTGHLRRSILVDSLESGLACEIGPTAGYGPYVEFGTRPHFPPPDALEAWARHHGFDSAWPICRAIAEHGVPEKPYLFPALDGEQRKFIERLEKLLEEAMK